MTITTRPLRGLLLSALAAIGLVGATSAGSANADPADPFVPITLRSSNVDFGNWGLFPDPINDPLSFGLLQWDTRDGTITPHLTGQMYLTDAQGLHARMAMSYYDVFDNRLAVRFGAERWASTDETHTWDVDMKPYSDPRIYRVVVSTTFKDGDKWVIRSAETVEI